jgi:hypothetical protein
MLAAESPVFLSYKHGFAFVPKYVIFLPFTTSSEVFFVHHTLFTRPRICSFPSFCHSAVPVFGEEVIFVVLRSEQLSDFFLLHVLMSLAVQIRTYSWVHLVFDLSVPEREIVLQNK